jgi:hypothetical protein
VKLPRLKRGAPAADEASGPRRRRRTPRANGPQTIIPGDAALGRPSWLPDDAPVETPLALDLDAARERLRREIPPVTDEDF